MSLFPIGADQLGGLNSGQLQGLLNYGRALTARPNYGWQYKAGEIAKGLLGNQDLAMALLANSGYGPKRSFGEILGTSALQAKQMGQERKQQEMENQFAQARLDALRNPVRKPIAIAGADGKPVYVDEQDAIGKSPFLQNNGLGAYQPGDYTPKSWAAFLANGQKDPSVLERHVPPRNESSRPFQNVQRLLPDGSTQQGTFDTRSGDYNWVGSVVGPGKKAEAEAAGAARGKVEGDLAAKGPRAYETFKVGVANLDKAMANTWTGPVVGRLPELTANQQIAGGAQSTMAPILKELFRQSGEGTFTEGDQKILIDMAPTRKDEAEARKAKIEMIDAIVKAKLGITGGATADGTSNAGPRKITGDADYNALPSGTEFIGPDGKRRRKP